MNILSMPPDWQVEHTSDAANLIYPDAPRICGLLIIVDPGMPAGSMSLVTDEGTTVRIKNIGTGAK